MQWEYRIIATHFIDGSEGERTMNEFGKEGWEFVAQISRQTSPGLIPHLRWVFKRPIGSRLT